MPPFKNEWFEYLKYSCDAIKKVVNGTVQQSCFPLTTLIRLFEFLKNSLLIQRINSTKLDSNFLELTLVEDDGIEPTTPCLQSRCSPS
jgi:hypothetical protein